MVFLRRPERRFRQHITKRTFLQSMNKNVWSHCVLRNASFRIHVDDAEKLIKWRIDSKKSHNLRPVVIQNIRLRTHNQNNRGDLFLKRRYCKRLSVGNQHFTSFFSLWLLELRPRTGRKRTRKKEIVNWRGLIQNIPIDFSLGRSKTREMENQRFISSFLRVCGSPVKE